mgnify:FL=1
MRIYFEILLLAAAIVILIYLSFYSAQTLLLPDLRQSLQNQVCFGKHCFFVELARTSAEREKGLMFASQLDKNSGMLFIFDKEDIHPFWMKNTLIPLDIIWIGSNNKVVFISKNTQSCKSLICPAINPGSKAKYVLEINAGMVEEIGLKIGDTAELEA